jgi:hypothetical protein
MTGRIAISVIDETPSHTAWYDHQGTQRFLWTNSISVSHQHNTRSNLSRPPQHPGKRAALFAGATILSLTMLEVFSCVRLASLPDLDSFPEVDQGSVAANETGSENRERSLATFVLHPYVGFVYDPMWSPRVNRFGYLKREPAFRPSPDTLFVAVFGGSAADALCQSGFLAEELKGAHGNGSRRVELVCLAMGWYKQPQQLLNLSYFLSLGAQFDVVVNYDGYNDVEIPVLQHPETGTYYAYPGDRWRFLSRRTVDIETAVQTARVVGARRDKEWWSDFFVRRTVLGRTHLVRLVRRIVNNAMVNRIRQETAELAVMSHADGDGYQQLGPPLGFPENELAARSVELWGRASAMMDSLCSANGIRYVHVLQPSACCDHKPLTEDERKVLTMLERYKPDDFAAKMVESYGLLQQEGRRLQAGGVAFTDLSRVFSDERRSVYRDHVHVNDTGNRILAGEIAAVVADAFEASSEAPSGLARD